MQKEGIYFYEEEDELYSVLMNDSKFHKEVIDKYVSFLGKYTQGGSSFINDGMRVYCKRENLPYDVGAGIRCVKLIDEYVREEIRLGNK